MTPEERFNVKIGGRTIEMLELLRCTEIVNCASNNAILAWFKLKDLIYINNKRLIKKSSFKISTNYLNNLKDRARKSAIFHTNKY